ncbi:hypothetical protein B0T11DRAFT_129058 [Plectosphaerella cucumerina]|uniref:PLD phosphodiesterase domain-containing protein n=1 Tax=Plectosphaerella cucumerina TaxID=40658 RepID=A0A8K0X047_9PEZI|nr:hypothetical protein B0T11DRAFT_129058 [Plectosphaerella cucumerina]
MSTTAIPRSFLDPWTQRLKDSRSEQLNDFPSYHVSDPETLVTSASLASLTVGNGAYIYRDTLVPAILDARHEVTLVTCFWAESDTLSSVQAALAELASRRRREIEAALDPEAVPPLRIRIGFSSRSFFQKIFHPWTRDGYVYPCSAWSKLGLPDQKVLAAARMDLQVKTLFFLPFSVMHPKFVIVDRERAFMPSCNVSWETWFEGCVEFTGPAVAQLVRFYASTWGRGEGQDWDEPQQHGDRQLAAPVSTVQHSALPTTTNSSCRKIDIDLPSTPAILLPSSHHANPAFRYLPFFGRKSPPPTPLNTALLTLFETAQARIDIITPNLTCSAVVNALLGALSRGVDVRIRTSFNMMLFEQIVTGLTTTEQTLKGLIKRYEQLVARFRAKALSDAETQDLRPGLLHILYYQGHNAEDDRDEPVLSHMKMTLVDRSFLLLGSGNLDRASWYTSQELGVLFCTPYFEATPWDEVWESRSCTRYRPKQADAGSIAESERRLGPLRC